MIAKSSMKSLGEVMYMSVWDATGRKMVCELSIHQVGG